MGGNDQNSDRAGKEAIVATYLLTCSLGLCTSSASEFSGRGRNGVSNRLMLDIRRAWIGRDEGELRKSGNAKV